MIDPLVDMKLLLLLGHRGRAPVLFGWQLVRIQNSPLLFFFCLGGEFFRLCFTILRRHRIEFFGVAPSEFCHLPQIGEYNLVNGLLKNVVNGTMQLSFGLIRCTLEMFFAGSMLKARFRYSLAPHSPQNK